MLDNISNGNNNVVNTQDLEFKKVVLIDSPLPNYASVPTKNNLKSRLRFEKNTANV